ncbi:MAG: thiamine diphosphokinase, partial [Lachnospiraceae bacterium]|nr:thiamine diphosphokinase [Lachnospiraceae bacterium]
MEKIIIVCGGIFDEDLARNLLTEKNNFIIAADKGLSHLIRMGIRPHAVIGDFDSVSEMDKVAIETYEKVGDATVIRLNPIKDATDTQAALELAMERKGDIYILGGTGRRLDHSIANIRLLGLALEKGRRLTILDTLNRVRMYRATPDSKGHITIGRNDQY